MNEQVKEKIKILAICGSLRKVSYTRMACQIALEGAKELGAEVELIDLRKYNLPFCKQYENDAEIPDDVFKLREEIREANGIILGTPDYHGSFSGVLKNVLDLMGFKEFEAKMIGLLSVSGGSLGASNSLDGLRTVGRQLHAWIIPNQVSIPSAYMKFDENGNINDFDLENRLKELGKQVTRFAFLHNSQKVLEFVKEWEKAPINPGG